LEKYLALRAKTLKVNVRSQETMNQEQQYTSLLAPQIPLRFLFNARQRVTSMRLFSHPVNDSGAFFRLWDLMCTLREPEVLALLDESTRDVYTRFVEMFDTLPWRPLDGEFSHIKQLDKDDLTVLVEPARQLSKQLSRLAWQLMPWSERLRRVIYKTTHWKT
jgi:hypothetical protein